MIFWCQKNLKSTARQPFIMFKTKSKIPHTGGRVIFLQKEVNKLNIFLVLFIYLVFLGGGGGGVGRGGGRLQVVIVYIS